MDWELIKNIAMTLGSVAAALAIRLMTFIKKMNEYFAKKKEDAPNKVVRQSDADQKILTKME